MKVYEGFDPFKNELASNKLFIKMKDQVNETDKRVEKAAKKKTEPISPKPLKNRQWNVKRETKEKFQRAREKIQLLHKGTSKGASPIIEEYYTETLDKTHRYAPDLNKFFNIWKELPDKSTPDNFSTWMRKVDAGEKVPGNRLLKENKLIGSDNKPIKRNADDTLFLSKVRYMDANERAKCELKGFGSRLYTEKSGGHLNTNENEHHAFVIGQDHVIYTDVYKKGELNHSSFLAGGAVISAGELEFKDGELKSISDKSGHYETNRQMLVKGLKIFREKGIDLSHVILYFQSYTHNFKTLNAKQFLELEEKKEYLAKIDHGKMSEKEAKDILKEFPKGVALLRLDPEKNKYVITVKKGGLFKYAHIPLEKLDPRTFEKAQIEILKKYHLTSVFFIRKPDAQTRISNPS